MTIHYDVPGIKRKKLAQTIASWIDAEVTYLGVPSFVYKIGFCKLNADGNLVIDIERHSPVVDALLEHLSQEGFDGREVDEDKQNEVNEFNVSLPRDSFTDEALENLKKLINSKKGLIKKALGTPELPIEISDETVSFPWNLDMSDSDATKTYTHFISALCEMARKQKRVVAAERMPENEKYSFRCFLLRLGFVGSEYKTERKILLRNLAGSSAFKNGVKK